MQIDWKKAWNVLKTRMRALAWGGRGKSNKLSLSDFAQVWVTAKPGFENE